MSEWLDNLKPGDEVIVKADGSHSRGYLRVVERTTKTLIILNTGSKFRRSDGREPGEWRHCHDRLVEPTPKNRETAERNVLEDRIEAKLKSMSRWLIEDLRRVDAAVAAAADMTILRSNS